MGGIDSRRLSMVAKLAGAPTAPSAGVDLHVHLGDSVEADSPVLTVHAEAPGELDYALRYVTDHANLVHIEEMAGQRDLKRGKK